MHPFLKRDALEAQIQRLYDGTGRPKDFFRINLIFAVGAIFLYRRGQHSIKPMNYYVTAMEQADDILGLASDDDIQNILLLVQFGSNNDIGGKSYPAKDV